MTSNVNNPLVQLKSLKHACILIVQNGAGINSLQAKLRSGFINGLISNQTQQAIMSACQPLHERPLPLGVKEDIKFLLEEIFEIEIEIMEGAINSLEVSR